MPAALYIIRHATPDWARTDIPYDVPPGPPLSEQGRTEARMLGGFLREVGLSRLYTSPMERAHSTAIIAAEVLGVAPVIAQEIIEQPSTESNAEAYARISPFVERLVGESEQYGPIGLVTHGGPMSACLVSLGMPLLRLRQYHDRYLHGCAAPPAGVWHARRQSATAEWTFDLVYTPGTASRE